MANVISEISLEQPLDKFAHVSDDDVDASNVTLIDISEHMYVCTKIWLKHTAAATSNRLYVTFDGSSPAIISSGGSVYVMSDDVLELENISFNGVIRVRGSAANQKVSVLCWGR